MPGLELAGGWLGPQEILLSEITTLRLLMETSVEPAEGIQLLHMIKVRQIWLSWNLEAQLDPDAYLADTLGITRFQKAMIEPQPVEFYMGFLNGEPSEWPEILAILEELKPKVPTAP